MQFESAGEERPSRVTVERMDPVDAIADTKVVSIDYTLRLDDGEIIDSSEGRDPLSFIHGSGQIIAGLEKELAGMIEGDEKHVVVSPAEGYGEYNSDMVETLPREMFPPDMALEKGMGFRMRTNAGNIVVAYIESFDENQVIVNLNHPLSGKTLHFDVKVVGVRNATPQELAGGCGSCGSCGSGGCGDGCGDGCGGEGDCCH